MGTIDKIIDGLNASKTDKITKLNKRFDENKSWMTKEFEQLRGLIGPRGAKGGVVKQASVSEVAKVPSSSSSAGSTSSSRRAVTAAAPAAAAGAGEPGGASEWCEFQRGQWWY